MHNRTTASGYARLGDDAPLALVTVTEVWLLATDIVEMALFKFGAICTAVFALGTLSSLFSYILHQTQRRMIRFTRN